MKKEKKVHRSTLLELAADCPGTQAENASMLADEKSRKKHDLHACYFQKYFGKDITDRHPDIDQVELDDI